LIRLAEEGFAVYGINYKNERADAIKWLAELGNPYRRIGADDDGRAGIEWGVYGLPETFVLDKGGRIRFKHVGPITPQDLDEVILPILRKLDS
jgi:cytochrome c biogenesis protein CcmG/thiol:disulfide interchange protein DsbE